MVSTDMGNYFTRKNITNWKWWVALVLLVITTVLLSPIAIVAAIIDILDNIVTYADKLVVRFIDKLDAVSSKLWARVGKWVKS